MDRWSQLSMKDKSDLMSLYIRNGISSLEEIKKHYNSYATGGSLPDYDPSNPYHYHDDQGKKVVITPEEWEANVGKPYFKEIEDAVRAEQAAYPQQEYEVNPNFIRDLKSTYADNMGYGYQNYRNFSSSLPQGYSFTDEGLVVDPQGNYYVQSGYQQSPRFTYNTNNPLQFTVNQGKPIEKHLTFYPVNMDRRSKIPLAVDRVMNVEQEKELAKEINYTIDASILGHGFQGNTYETYPTPKGAKIVNNKIVTSDIEILNKLINNARKNRPDYNGWEIGTSITQSTIPTTPTVTRDGMFTHIDYSSGSPVIKRRERLSNFGFKDGGHLYQDGGSGEPNFVGGATALKKDYDYELEHLADKYAVTASGPWHNYGINNPSSSQKSHWNELAKMYDRVSQRPNYEYLNPINITEYTPVIGDAIDVGRSVYDLQQGNIGVGLAGLGMLTLPNVIEKPLKAIGKPIINTLDSIRYYKYKKNAPHIANKAYTDHLSRVGLTLENVPMITSGHEEDLVKEHIKQAGYNIENIEDRVRFLRDQGYISGNISKQKVDDYILHLLRSGKYNANSTPAHYSATDLGSSFIAVGDDAGRTISDIVNESDLSYPATLGKNIILNNSKVSYDFPWYNLNNQSIKSHELTHYLQYKHNLKHNPLYHSLIDYDKIKAFPKKWEDELMKNNATEVDARLSQILDFYDISDDKNIKPSQIRYIRNNYRGSDNNMRMFFESLIDDNKKIADYINDASHRKYLKYGGKVKDDIKNKELIIKDNFIEKSLEDFLK